MALPTILNAVTFPTIDCSREGRQLPGPTAYRSRFPAEQEDRLAETGDTARYGFIAPFRRAGRLRPAAAARAERFPCPPGNDR